MRNLIYITVKIMMCGLKIPAKIGHVIYALIDLKSRRSVRRNDKIQKKIYTRVAAQNLGCCAIGIEKNVEYVEIAKARLM